MSRAAFLQLRVHIRGTLLESRVGIVLLHWMGHSWLMGRPLAKPERYTDSCLRVISSLL